MTVEELKALQSEIPYVQKYIEKLSNYMESSGKQYANHAATIRSWALRDTPVLTKRNYSCQQEEYEKQEAEHKQKEFLIQVSRLKANGLQDKALKNYTFANDKGFNPEIKKAYDYVAHWEEMRVKSLGLLLWENVGIGKSFFAGCIANALL